MNGKKLKLTYGLLLLAIICSFFVFQFTETENEAVFTNENKPQSENVSPKELFTQSCDLVRKNYWNKSLTEAQIPKFKKRYEKKIKDNEDAKVAINTILQSLDDPYSKFLDKEEFEELNSSINSKIYGIGINIATEAGKTYIINVIKNTPADLAGLKSGDLITKINNESTAGKNMFQVANEIRNPKTETVTLEVLRGNSYITRQVKKAEIKIKTVKSEIINKDIGYIKISSFISNDAPVEFIDAIEKIKNTEGLVLDLRGNTGGLFQNAIFVSDIFLNGENIVSVLGRGGQKSVYKSHNRGYIYKKPMVVLVDSESASASEIVSGALKDNKRATIIGTRTFGKGLVQKVFPTSGNTGINLTIARYLTPNNHDINKKGITPDYVIQITDKDILSNNDRQLNFALQTLKAEIERRKLATK